MSTANNPNPGIDPAANNASSTPTPTSTSIRGPRKRWLMASALFLTGTLVGGAAVTGAAAYAFGGHGGWHHGAKWEPGAVKERARDRMALVLGRVDATDEQERQIAKILDALVDDMTPMVAEHRARREALVTALSGEVVDVESLESMRSSLVESVDAGSRVMTRTLVESAAVLTPAQRATLLEAMHRHRR
jgi:protein CpxP